MINDYCNKKLVNGFQEVESYHFILTATNEILYERIRNQENRDVDLALTYMPDAMAYFNKNYSEACRIETSNLSIDEIAEKITKIITG